MKKYIAITAIAAASALIMGNSLAQTAPAAEVKPDPGPVTANVTLASDYRYRGITQGNFRPALQGGFDYAHESGFYIGNWNSSISWLSDGYGSNPAVSAPIEMDFYGGYKTEVAGVALDGGLLQYYYSTKNMPGSTTVATCKTAGSRNACGVNPNTTEAYFAATYQFAMLKYSYALTDLFGIYDSKGASYIDLALNYDTGFEGITLNGHVGRQMISTKTDGVDYSYTDWKIGLTKDLGKGLNVAVAYIGTNAKKAAYYVGTKNSGQGTGFISLTKTF
ncbi:MAG: TorF family putative porin [Polynucleobacter sp.]|nr:TorF family putative porin [Polynucleobacter sp.]